MGREVRRVPKDFEHPKKADGAYLPLLEGDFLVVVREWRIGQAQWSKGCRESFTTKGEWVLKDDDETESWEEWAGEKPEIDEHMPHFKEGEATHYMWYENTSEGTPLSPAMASEKDLAQWLAEDDPSTSYAVWLGLVITGGRPTFTLGIGGTPDASN